MKSKIVDVFITLGACYLLVEAGFNMYPVCRSVGLGLIVIAATAAAATELRS